MLKSVAKFLLALSIIGLITAAESALSWSKECSAADLRPIVMAATPVVKMDDVGNIILMGTGFKPGAEIYLYFVTPDGQQSELNYAMKPAPKPNKTGTWSTTWNARDYVKTKLVVSGAYKIMVTDEDLTLITQTAIFFQLDDDQKGKEKTAK